MNLSKISIQSKIRIILFFCCIPVFVVFFLYHQEKKSQINFTRDEINGLANIQHVQEAYMYAIPLLLDVQAKKTDNIKEDLGKFQESFHGLEQAHKNYFVKETDKSFDSLKQAYHKISAEKIDSDDVNKLIEALDKYIEDLGNNSNLVLDPDIDSYYTMDNVVVEIKNLLNQITTIQNLSHKTKDQKLNQEDRESYVLTKGKLDMNANVIQSNIETAIKGNESGHVQKTLKESTDGFLKEVDSFKKEVDPILSLQRSDETSKTTASTSYLRLSNIALEYWKNSISELDFLLNSRLDGLRGSFYSSLALCLSILGIAILVSQRIISQITNGIKRLIRYTDEVKNTQNYGIKIDTQLQDEIGLLTHAVNEFVQNVDLSRKREETLNTKRQEEILTAQAQEKEVTLEISKLIEYAAKGNLDQRINLGSSSSEMLHSMGNTVNKLISTTQLTVNEVSEVVQSMASGDLTKKILSDFEGTFGELKSNINTMSSRLSETVSNIRNAAILTDEACEEITNGVTDLENRTLNQEQNIKKITEAVQGILQSVQTTSDQTHKVENHIEVAHDHIKEGISTSDHSTKTMSKIEESSQEIEKIVQVIDGISFQTNLLALNASVEAARAGSAGSGFAVVASEVRSLAGQCANSSQQIRALIEKNNAYVREGSRSVKEVSESLNTAIQVMNKIIDTIKIIVDNSKSQAQFTSQISFLIDDFERDIQNNSSLVTECVTTLGSLKMNMHALRNMTQYFQVSDHKVYQASAQVH